jgi:hypothetical protein
MKHLAWLALAFAVAAAPAASRARADDGPEDPGKEKKPAAEETTIGGVRDRISLERELRALRADINILNLVNGLNLTPHQIVHLLRAAREAKEVQDDATPPPKDPEVAAKEFRALERIRASLLAGDAAPEDAVRDLDNLRTRVRAPRRTGLETSKRLREIEDEVDAVLLPSQREVIRTYKPCLVPPQSLRDPVRVGQASDAGPMRRLLEHVVGVPADRWGREGPAILDRVLDAEQEHLGRLNAVEEKERREALVRAFEEARAMDAATFEMKKDLLAERIQPEDRIQSVHLELEGIADAQGRPGKTASILLDPRVVPILEKRLEQLKAAARTPVDLEAVREADRCKDGHCAVRKEKTGD